MIKTLFILSLFLFSACSGEWREYPQSNYTQGNAEQVIGVGDKLSVTVFGEEGLSDEYVVLSDGTIQMPLVGTVIVQQKTLEQAQEIISESFIKEGYLVNPKITLSIVQSPTVKIMGEIMDAGVYSYTADMTILDLVAKAGGFSYRANQNHFDIVRKTPMGGSEQVVSGGLSTRIKPGDIIRVKERFF